MGAQAGSTVVRTSQDVEDVSRAEVALGDALSVKDVRAVSKAMFARMGTLEEGTHEYQYVRNCLIEANMALVRY
ncbi:RNA polymerase sigma factor SigF, partial [Streptomyces sp. PTM05]|nr:RNA polymerase sigma factor SigF [Streptantibioticus parmotrematis]